MTLQAQWDLEKTADSAISISRGLLQAATSDNVQPLAIMACERFGNTLALCPETCRKVEKTVLPTPPHAVLKFLQGTVGYSPNDCATYFGTSQAGLQFLSFATALMEDLIESLEPRCHLSRFIDEVIGWQGLFRDLASEYDKSFARGVGYCDDGVPDAVALKSIVDAFRELSRIGNSGAVRVTFTTLSLVSWLIAFTKWCLGSPPSTYMEGGTPLMETADSKVRIQVLRTGHPSRKLLEITLEYSIGSPRDLASGAARGTWVGMVGLRTYCLWLLRDLNVGRGSALTAVKSAIAAAVKEAVGNISFVAIDKSSNEGGKELKTDTRRRFRDLRLQPLRDTSHVLSLMFEDYDSSDRPSDRLSILQIPAVRIHCRSSHVELEKAIEDADEEIAFQENCFLWTLVEIVAVVLALSLYQHPEC